MAAFVIEIVNGAGFDRTVAQLGTFAGDVPKAMNTEFVAAMKAIRTQFSSKQYPPERPNQVYVRTGRFGRSWKYLALGNSAHMIRNNATFEGITYASFVVGNGNGGGQAKIHEGRWWLAKPAFALEVGKFATVIGAKFKDID